jgi:hypothetical protein
VISSITCIGPDPSAEFGVDHSDGLSTVLSGTEPPGEAGQRGIQLGQNRC